MITNTTSTRPDKKVEIKDATMPSQFSRAHANRCIDGNVTKAKVVTVDTMCHARKQADPWLQLELKQKTWVSRIRIYNRADNCRHRLQCGNACADCDGTDVAGAGIDVRVGDVKCERYYGRRIKKNLRYRQTNRLTQTDMMILTYTYTQSIESIQ